MKTKLAVPLILLILSITLTQCTMKKSPDNQKMIEEIIISMSMEEKAQLVIGTGMFFDLPMPESMLAQFEPMLRQFGWMNKPETDNDTIYTMMVDRIRTYLPGSAGNTAEFPSKGITSQVMADGPAGLRIQSERKNDDETYFATAFPIATLLASSWDTELIYGVGQAMGNQVLEFGADVLLAPGMNLQRDPLCGRNFEYYSEDPLVTGKMAAAIVNGIQSNGVGTSIKHFAANNQETSRRTSNSIVSARALRELYLRGFEIAVKEAQPWTVMSSYNLINGVPASESRDLLTSILRDDWGFEGYVVTDWMGGTDLIAQMKAGNDLIMPGRFELIKEIIVAVEAGTLDEKVLDRNISRILGIMMNAPRYNEYPFSSSPDLEAHAAVARRAAAEGMVLLKNEASALPLAENISTIAAFGNASYEIIIGGTGSGDVNEAYTISLIQGLTGAGYSASEELSAVYQSYMTEARAKQGPSMNPLAALMGSKDPLPEMAISAGLASEQALSADVALIVIGRNAGEGGDRKAVEGDFFLTQVEIEMISNVSEAFQANGKMAIVILNIGGVIETASWREFPDAILCAWQPGQEGGHPIVDVLSGTVNPSGKLAVTFPISYEDAPTTGNFPGTIIESASEPDSSGQPASLLFGETDIEVIYEEDIYVGYRYYNTFDIPVAYEFGYGLSYTTFEYSNLVIDSPEFDGTLKLSADIKNTGMVTGREVVQIYVSAPGKDMDKPAGELVTFGKTGLLEPGESQTMEFEITARDIASFDEASSSWVAEKGTYTLKVGRSSRLISETTGFDLSDRLSVETVSGSLLPTREITRLFVE